MEIIRGNESHTEYISEDGLVHNTGYLAIEDDKVVGIFEYEIKNLKYAEVINIEVLNRETLESFLDELEYWNPFIEEVIIKDKMKLGKDILLKAGFLEEDGGYTYSFKNPLDIFEIDMDDIKIGQLTVSKDKLERVEKWVQESQDIVVNLIEIDGQMVCIDGNSRLVAGHRKGIEKVYGYLSKEEDLDFYRECLAWCEADGVNRISDLAKRVVSQEEHERIWIGRCQAYFNS